jgi:uncharacterized ParB-like nuclease family protein
VQSQVIKQQTGIGDQRPPAVPQLRVRRPMALVAAPAKLDPLVEALGKAARQETARTHGTSADWR